MFQAAQLLSQHFLGNTVDETLQIGEALNLRIEEVKEDQQLPPATQQLQYSVHIVCCRRGCIDLFVAHCRHLLFRAFLSSTVWRDDDVDPTDQARTSMTLTTEPAIQAYFASESDAGVGALETVFAPDAAVMDEGMTHSGIEAIKAWKKAAKQKYQYTVEPLDSHVSDIGIVVKARLAGTFPGSPVVVAFTFGVQRGKIQTLEIR